MTSSTPQPNPRRDEVKVRRSIEGTSSDLEVTAPKCEAAQPASRPMSVPSARALTMLTLIPVGATPLPRIHVRPRHPDGTLRVMDRPTGQNLIVYTPRFIHQFCAGHRAGRWYVRPSTFVGSVPQSPGFATARAAIEALSSGRWSALSLLTERAGRVPRVL
jgi:hypothetical protein